MLPPYANVDITDSVEANRLDTQSNFRSWHLWPFTLDVATTRYGSKTYILQFCVVRKFSVGMSFFWKAAKKSSENIR